MNLAAAHRQLDAPVLLSLLTAIDRTRARIGHFRFGAWHLPGVNDDTPHREASA